MTNPVHVTDHAVLRWLQRVEGVDVDAIRRRIHKSALIGAEHGAANVVKDGVRFVLVYHPAETRVVTTVSKQVRSHLSLPRGEVDAGEE